MDQRGLEGGGRGGTGLDGLIDSQGAGLDMPLQQVGQVACRLPGTGNQQRAGPRSPRPEQGGQPIQIAVRGLHVCEPRGPGGPGRGVADREDRTAAVRRQGGEGRDAVGAGKGKGGDPGQVRRGLGDRADGQKGGDDGREA